jgi:hypothetical protein
VIKRSPGKNEIWIEHSGRKIGYTLARDENGDPMFQAGLVDQHAPQRVTEGFGYPALPANANVSIEIGDWSDGAGMTTEVPGSQSTKRYSHSQGLDLSWPGSRAYLSLARQAGTDLGDTIRKYRFTSIGTFAITDTEVWEWDLATTAWIQRLAAVTPTDIQEFEGNVFIAMGTNAYRYTANGTAFTTSTAAFNTFERFSLRSGQTGGAVLWGVDANGDLRWNQNPINGGDAWSATNVVGDTWETVTSLVVADDFVLVMKEEGIYSFDGTLIEDIFPARTLADTDNGRLAYVWVDGLVYLNYGDRVQQFDAATRTMRDIWPQPETFGHPELNGTITAIGGDADNLWFAIKNAAGNTYIMKGDPRKSLAFHSVLYLGANDCTALSSERVGDMHASNPALVVSYGTFASYYILPGAGLRPEDDATVTFESTGFAFWPWLDGGASLWSKWITAGRVVAENTLEIGGIAKTANLVISLDGASNETDLTSSITPGITVGVPPESIRFTWVRPKVEVSTSNTSETPVLKGIVLDTTPNPPRRRAWDFVIDSGDENVPIGGMHRFTGWDPVDHLFSSTSAEVLFYDRRSRRFVVKVDDIQQVRLGVEHLKDRELYQLHIFEMGAQGYLSVWHGLGNKFLLPDMPGGAVGLNDEAPAANSGTWYPVDNTDHARWTDSASLTHSYIRFQNVEIPNGATITRARVRLRLFSVIPQFLDIDQYMEDADTGSAPLTTTAAEALTLTTATTRYQATLTGADSWWTWFEFADMTAVVQEIVDRASWAPGNDMTYVGRQRAVTGDFWSQWFDTTIFSGSGQEILPELYVEWE